MSNQRICSFCGRDQQEVGRLIAGARALICDRCVESCADNFSGGSTWDNATHTWIEHAPRSPWPHQRQSHFGDDAACSFCGKAEPELQWLVGCRWPNTFVCDECVGLYLTSAPDPLTGQAPKGRAPGRRASRWFHWPWQAPHGDKAIRL